MDTIATPAEVERLLAELPDEISNAGRELTLQIAYAIAGRHEATRPGTQRICTAIARAAKSHGVTCEILCESLDEDQEERAMAQRDGTEERISRLVRALPAWSEPPGITLHAWGVLFQHDPRGCTVKLTGPRFVYDDFGNEGVCVPQR